MAKKILFVTHVFPPAVDGGARLLSWFAWQLRRQGHEVEVWTSDARSSDDFLNPQAPRLERKTRWRGISVRRWRTWRYGRPIIRRLLGPVFLWLPCWIKNKPQVIISGPFPTLAPYYAWALAKLWGSRLVLVPCFHQGEAGFYRWRFWWLLRQADKIIALSRSEKILYSQRGVSKEKIAVLRANLAGDLMMAEKQAAQFLSPPAILFLGSQAAHKRIEWLLEAFWMMKKVATSEFSPENERIAKARLMIVGPKTLYSPIIRRKYRQLFNNNSNVQILGYVKEKRKIELLDRAWLLVNPSRGESLGIVFMEAWARKKPVIAADLPALREWIGNGGSLVKTKQALAKKMANYLARPGWAKKVGERGFAKLSRMKTDKNWWNFLWE